MPSYSRGTPNAFNGGGDAELTASTVMLPFEPGKPASDPHHRHHHHDTNTITQRRNSKKKTKTFGKRRSSYDPRVKSLVPNAHRIPMDIRIKEENNNSNNNITTTPNDGGRHQGIVVKQRSGRSGNDGIGTGLSSLTAPATTVVKAATAAAAAKKKKSEDNVIGRAKDAKEEVRKAKNDRRGDDDKAGRRGKESNLSTKGRKMDSIDFHSEEEEEQDDHVGHRNDDIEKGSGWDQEEDVEEGKILLREGTSRLKFNNANDIKKSVKDTKNSISGGAITRMHNGRPSLTTKKANDNKNNTQNDLALTKKRLTYGVQEVSTSINDVVSTKKDGLVEKQDQSKKRRRSDTTGKRRMSSRPSAIAQQQEREEKRTAVPSIQHKKSQKGRKAKPPTKDARRSSSNNIIVRSTKSNSRGIQNIPGHLSQRILLNLAKKHHGTAVQYMATYHTGDSILDKNNFGKHEKSLIESGDLVIQQDYANAKGTYWTAKFGFRHWKLPGQRRRDSSMYTSTRPTLADEEVGDDDDLDHEKGGEIMQPRLTMDTSLSSYDASLVRRFVRDAKAGMTPFDYFAESELRNNTQRQVNTDDGDNGTLFGFEDSMVSSETKSLEEHRPKERRALGDRSNTANQQTRVRKLNAPNVGPTSEHPKLSTKAPHNMLRTKSARKKRKSSSSSSGQSSNKKRQRTPIQFFVPPSCQDENVGYQDQKHFGLIEGMGGGEEETNKGSALPHRGRFMELPGSVMPGSWEALVLNNDSSKEVVDEKEGPLHSLRISLRHNSTLSSPLECYYTRQEATPSGLVVSLVNPLVNRVSSFVKQGIFTDDELDFCVEGDEKVLGNAFLSCVTIVPFSGFTSASESTTDAEATSKAMLARCHQPPNDRRMEHHVIRKIAGKENEGIMFPCKIGFDYDYNFLILHDDQFRVTAIDVIFRKPRDLQNSQHVGLTESKLSEHKKSVGATGDGEIMQRFFDQHSFKDGISEKSASISSKFMRQHRSEREQYDDQMLELENEFNSAQEVPTNADNDEAFFGGNASAAGKTTSEEQPMSNTAGATCVKAPKEVLKDAELNNNQKLDIVTAKALENEFNSAEVPANADNDEPLFGSNASAAGKTVSEGQPISNTTGAACVEDAELNNNQKLDIATAEAKRGVPVASEVDAQLQSDGVQGGKEPTGITESQVKDAVLKEGIVSAVGDVLQDGNESVASNVMQDNESFAASGCDPFGDCASPGTRHHESNHVEQRTVKQTENNSGYQIVETGKKDDKKTLTAAYEDFENRRNTSQSVSDNAICDHISSNTDGETQPCDRHRPENSAKSVTRSVTNRVDRDSSVARKDGHNIRGRRLSVSSRKIVVVEEDIIDESLFASRTVRDARRRRSSAGSTSLRQATSRSSLSQDSKGLKNRLNLGRRTSSSMAKRRQHEFSGTSSKKQLFNNSTDTAQTPTVDEAIANCREISMQPPRSQPILRKKRPNQKNNRRVTISDHWASGCNIIDSTIVKKRKRSSINPMTSRKKPKKVAVVDLFSDDGSYFGCEILAYAKTKARQAKAHSLRKCAGIERSSVKSAEIGSSCNLSDGCKSNASSIEPRRLPQLSNNPDDLQTSSIMEATGQVGAMENRNNRDKTVHLPNNDDHSYANETQRVFEPRTSQDETAKAEDTLENRSIENNSVNIPRGIHSSGDVPCLEDAETRIVEPAYNHANNIEERDDTCGGIESHKKQENSGDILGDDRSIHSSGGASCPFGSYNNDHVANESAKSRISIAQPFHDVLFGLGNNESDQSALQPTSSSLEPPSEESQLFHDYYYGQQSGLLVVDEAETIGQAQPFYDVYFGLSDDDASTLSEEDMGSLVDPPMDRFLPFHDYYFGYEPNLVDDAEDKTNVFNKAPKRNPRCTVQTKPLLVITLIAGMLSRALAYVRSR